jgi:uncharacterized protein YbaA (DUF1428 family)
MYVDGFVLSVPKKKLAAYRSMANRINARVMRGGFRTVVDL